MSMTPTYWKKACAELSANDPIMAGIIASYDGEFLVGRGDGFYSLARSIVGQQISVKAAASVWVKFENIVDKVSPDYVNKTTEDDLRSAGLSRQKIKYLKNLSEHFLDGSVDEKSFKDKSDEEIIKDLTQVKGIGRWTAEMFLIFYMLRPDVFPIDDIGLQKAIVKHYGDVPILEIGKTWQPWRSVATWYLWRSLDPEPVEY